MAFVICWGNLIGSSSISYSSFVSWIESNWYYVGQKKKEMIPVRLLALVAVGLIIVGVIVKDKFKPWRTHTHS